MLPFTDSDFAAMQGQKGYSNSILDFIIEMKYSPQVVFGYDKEITYKWWKFKLTKTEHVPGIAMPTYIALVKRLNEHGKEMEKKMNK